VKKGDRGKRRRQEKQRSRTGKNRIAASRGRLKPITQGWFHYLLRASFQTDKLRTCGGDHKLNKGAARSLRPGNRELATRTTKNDKASSIGLEWFVGKQEHHSGGERVSDKERGTNP